MDPPFIEIFKIASNLMLHCYSNHISKVFQCILNLKEERVMAKEASAHLFQ
jgi:hypothetical protein